MDVRKKGISKKLLAAGLFRIAYGVDAPRHDLETVYELFVFSAIALEENGCDPAELVAELESDQFNRTELVTRAIDTMGHDHWREYPESLLLLAGLHEMLRMQFSESEQMARSQFLEELESMANAS